MIDSPAYRLPLSRSELDYRATDLLAGVRYSRDRYDITAGGWMTRSNANIDAIDYESRFASSTGIDLDRRGWTGRFDVRSPNCRIYKAIYPEAVRLEGLRLLAGHASDEPVPTASSRHRDVVADLAVERTNLGGRFADRRIFVSVPLPFLL